MDCVHIPELGYGDFSLRLHDKATQDRIPLGGSLELTLRCNLRCQHCYLMGMRDGIPGMRELSLEEYRGIFDQLADAGTLWLLMTGGEPLVRSDFMDIYESAKRRGFIVTLFTNATLITPRIADFLAEWRPFQVEVSLYGRTQETYERVTGIPGSHARCMRGIELLVARGIKVNLKTIAMTLNVHELDAMQTFADDLGVSFRFDPVINAGLNGSQAPVSFRLSPEQIVALDLQDERRMDGFHRFVDQFGERRGDSRYLYQCGAGIRSFHIDPYGKLSICMMSRAQQYDLRGGTFREGWGDFLKKVRFQPAPVGNKCANCPLLALCGQCPAVATMENADPLSPVAFLCEITHLRAEALGLEH
ncbi:MAG: radical SAM protein [Anaerolineae bacterium]|nr:radical SAM protein [Anaerolineae bacterium]